MKHKHFYSHLIETTHLTLEIGELEIEKEERVELLSLADANIHTHVVHTVLSELEPQDKKIFLQNIISNDHKKTWQHLLLKIDNVEEKIQKTIGKVINEFIEDVRKAK
jgi:hypothetical protein